jgi:DNA-binding transcriptional LysR family regulator
VAALPFSTDQLHVTILYEEPRVLLVPLGHRLAGRQSVTIDDIADEPIPKFRDCDPAWNDFWRIDPRPDGRGAPEGPLLETLEDGLELIAAGQAVAITIGFFERLRPDITTVPLEGVEPGHVVLASRAGDRSRLVAAFRKLAAVHLTGPGRT